MRSGRRSVAAAASAAALVLAVALCTGPRTIDAVSTTRPPLTSTSTRQPTQAANQPTMISAASQSASSAGAPPATTAANATTRPAAAITTTKAAVQTTTRLVPTSSPTTTTTVAQATNTTTRAATTRAPKSTTTQTTVRATTKPASTAGQTTKKTTAQTATTPRPSTSAATAPTKPPVLRPSAFSSLPGGCYQATGTGRLSQQHVVVLMQQLEVLLRQSIGTDALGNQYRQLIAGSVRLAFHACVGSSCGGCINVNDPANNGLDITISALTAFRAQLLQVPQFANCTLSHADLWQATAAVALNDSVFNTPSTNVCLAPVVFGRTDCPTAPYTNEILTFPDRRWTIDPLLAFAAKLNLTARQFVALLGLHSLGVVRDFNGRVMAQWDRSADVANDATFFQTLANQAKQWTAVPFNYTSNSTPVMYSFSKDSPTNRLIFLTADFTLSYNISQKDPTVTGQPTAPLASYPFSSTYSYVQQFAMNVTTWAQAVCGAWPVLTNRGYAPGALLAAAVSSG